jgi:hypothetical protein
MQNTNRSFDFGTELSKFPDDAVLVHLEVASQAGKLGLQLLPLGGCVRELKCRLLLDEGEFL